MHVFCVQLGMVTPESYPDGGNVLHAILHACFDESATRGTGKLGVRPDASGISIFEIQECKQGSWLSISNKLMRDAVSRMMGSHVSRGVLLELREPKRQNEQHNSQSSTGNDIFKLRTSESRLPNADVGFIVDHGLSRAHIDANKQKETYRSLLLPPR